MRIQDTYNQIADRFVGLDRKYWVIALSVLVGLTIIQQILFSIMASTGGLGGFAAQVYSFAAGFTRQPVSVPVLVLLLHSVSTFWLGEIGTRFRRCLVPVALVVVAAILVGWIARYWLYRGHTGALALGVLTDLLMLIAVALPTIIKVQLLSRESSGRPSTALWWEMSALALLVIPELAQILSMITQLVMGAVSAARSGGGGASSVLGVAVMASWYFWFDRMWRVRFNRVLATLHLATAMVGPLTLAIYAIGLDALSVWRRLETGDRWSMPASGDGVNYAAVVAMGDHVTLFNLIANALFLIVFLEAMVRKMMGGTDPSYDAATARSLRRYAALVLLAGLLFMGGNFIVYSSLTL
ncbi:MAG: hypothetical protein QUV02_05105 [Maricaulis sp.]|uniref:hypothetical protein n=1 Tax=Maricaulis sp. TaxID=1486257 RepID=UPI002624B1AE|nr:hypothetical protein [Maricaulis sp.]MDM7983806.1 hypothetical protein [Maricaulis sp.]